MTDFNKSLAAPVLLTAWLFAAEPYVSNIKVIYPAGQTAAKTGDYVTITAQISSLAVNTTRCNASAIGGSTSETLWDDGNHNDGLASDGIFGTNPILVDTVGTANHSIWVAASVGASTTQIYGTVGVDNQHPFITLPAVVYPTGQTAAKNKDEVFIKAHLSDVGKIIDELILIDRSTSMRGQDIVNARNAAKVLVDGLDSTDRAGLLSFGTTVDFEYWPPDTNRQAIKASIDGLNAEGLTDLYDAIGTAVDSIQRFSNDIPVVIVLSDGERVHEPSKIDIYSRTDCYFLPVPVFTIAYGAGGGGPDVAFLDSVAITSSGGKFYNAPTGAALDSVANDIKNVIANLDAPKGIQYAYADASPIGGPSKVLMYDDGAHNDGAAFDTVFGSGPITVNSGATGQYNLEVYAWDMALNSTMDTALAGLDNAQPVMGSLQTHYPAGKLAVHNSEKSFFTIAVSDTGTPGSLSRVILDATQMGGGSALVMRNDGVAPDTAVDGVYTSDSITVNTTEFSGDAMVYAYGFDAAANKSPAAGAVRVDNQAPEISDLRIDYPGDQPAARQGDFAVLSVLVTDKVSIVDTVFVIAGGLDSGSARYALLDNGSGADETAGDHVYAVKLEVTDDTTAAVTFSIIARDAETNADTVTGNAVLDNSAPIVATVRVLDADSVYQNGETVALLCSTDASGYTVTGNFTGLDGHFLSGAVNVKDNGDSTYTLTYTISETDTVSDGLHTVYVVAEDGAGLKDTGSAVVLMDNSTPSVALTVPVPDTLLSGEISVQFMARDDDSVYTTEISVDGQDWSATNARTASVLNTTLLRDGAHTVQIRATDGHGNTGYSPLTSFKTINSPSVTIRNLAGGEALNAVYPVAFSAVPVTPASIVKREVSLDGGAWTDSLVDSVSYPLNTRDWEDGTHTIQIRARDDRGHMGYSSRRSFIADNSPPRISLPEIRYDGGMKSGRKGIRLIVSALVFDLAVGLGADSGAVFMSDNLDTVKIMESLKDDGIDSVSGDRVKGDNVYSAVIPINTDSTGLIEYAIRAWDRLGNDTTLIATIVLDNEKPEVSYTLGPEPKSKDKTKGEVYVNKVIMKGRVVDANSGLALVRLTARNDSGSHVNNSPFELKPEQDNFSRIINLAPGANIITLLAVDKAGNSNSLQTTVDYILPKVTQMVTPDKEFTVRSPNGSKVVIPKKALHHAGEITLRVVDQDEEPKPLEQDVKLLGVPHEFGPSNTVFRKPVEITLAYSDLDLDPDQDLKPDYKPLDLAIYFWDGARWLLAGVSHVDTAARTVSVAVNHFTLYDIGLDTTGASPVSEKFSAYWTHNPVKQEEGSTFVVNVPKKGRLSLRIFDMAGDLVNAILPEKQVESGLLSLMWRGDNVRGYFAGAGLYIYMLKYEADDGSIKKLIRKPVGLLKE